MKDTKRTPVPEGTFNTDLKLWADYFRAFPGRNLTFYMGEVIFNAEVLARFDSHKQAMDTIDEARKLSKVSEVAVFNAVQSGFEKIPDFELWTLLIDIPGHPKNSTVRRETIEEAGYTLPKI